MVTAGVAGRGDGLTGAAVAASLTCGWVASPVAGWSTAPPHPTMVTVAIVNAAAIKIAIFDIFIPPIRKADEIWIKCANWH
jgi:hypothetical protein